MKTIYNVIFIIIGLFALIVITLITVSHVDVIDPALLFLLGITFGSGYAWTINLFVTTISNFKQNKHETYHY